MQNDKVGVKTRKEKFREFDSVEDLVAHLERPMKKLREKLGKAIDTPIKIDNLYHKWLDGKHRPTLVYRLTRIQKILAGTPAPKKGVTDAE